MDNAQSEKGKCEQSIHDAQLEGVRRAQRVRTIVGLGRIGRTLVLDLERPNDDVCDECEDKEDK